MIFAGKHEVNQEEIDSNSGIFRFTNATDEDFVTLWNNKEYTYPAGKTIVMFIADESPERVQSIRKMFAKRLAEREYFKSKDFSKVRNGIKDAMAGRYVIPSTYDERELQPWVDQCLTPLEEGRAKIRTIPDEKPNVIGKAIGSGTKDNPYPKVDLNAEFKDSNDELLSK